MKLKASFLIGVVFVITACGDDKGKDKDCSESVLQDYNNDAKALVSKPTTDKKKYCDNMASKYEKYDGCKIPINVIFTDASGTIGVREFSIKTLKDACNRM